MSVTKQRLYDHRAVVAVRSSRTAIDAAAWTPDNLIVPETADGVTLDAREWQSVQLVVDFEDAGGAPVAGGSVDVAFLMATRDPAAASGRRWKEFGSSAGVTGDDAVSVAAAGHDVAVRLDALTLSGATSVSLKVTGGALL